MIDGRRLALACVLLAAGACASGGRKSNCVPVPAEFLTAGPAYSDCEVSRRAEVKKVPRVEFTMRSDGAAGCSAAYIDVIVDTTGRLVPSTAKLTRTNNKAYAEAVMRQLDEVQYEPAEKNGQRVAQLVHYKASIVYMTAIVRAGTVPPSPNASGGMPRC